jgi:hypothetical protein
MLTGVFDSLSLLGEGGGEDLSANCNYSVAAGFSPQSVQEFVALSTALKNLNWRLVSITG